MGLTTPPPSGTLCLKDQIQTRLSTSAFAFPAQIRSHHGHKRAVTEDGRGRNRVRPISKIEIPTLFLSNVGAAELNVNDILEIQSSMHDMNYVLF